MRLRASSLPAEAMRWRASTRSCRPHTGQESAASAVAAGASRLLVDRPRGCRAGRGERRSARSACRCPCRRRSWRHDHVGLVRAKRSWWRRAPRPPARRGRAAPTPARAQFAAMRSTALRVAAVDDAALARGRARWNASSCSPPRSRALDPIAEVAGDRSWPRRRARSPAERARRCRRATRRVAVAVSARTRHAGERSRSARRARGTRAGSRGPTAQMQCASSIAKQRDGRTAEQRLEALGRRSRSGAT